MIGIVFYLAVGFGMGLLSWAVMPRPERIHPFFSVGIALTGSFIGGIFMALIVDERIFAMQRCGILGSITGAGCLLFAVCSIVHDNARHFDSTPTYLKHQRVMPGATDRPRSTISPQISPLYLADRHA